MKDYVERLRQKHNKGMALGILSQRLGRALYYMLRRREYFDQTTFIKQA